MILKGFVTFEELCKDICNYYDIQYNPQHLIDIEQALWLGVSNDFDITHRLLVHMKEQGIKCKCVFIPNMLDSIPKNTSKLTEKRIVSIGRLDW